MRATELMRRGVLIKSILHRHMSSTGSAAEPGTTNQTDEATRFDESLKALTGVGARRELLGSLGVAGVALLTALGLGEATAADTKNKNGPGKKQHGNGKGKNAGDNASKNQTDAATEKSPTDAATAAIRNGKKKNDD